MTRRRSVSARRLSGAFVAAVVVLASPVGFAFGASLAHAASCHAVRGRPDTKCTPGARNPAVTPSSISITICVSGWTGKVRPPARQTNVIKSEREIAYGIPGPHPKSFKEEELDHLIPLALGGAPRAVKNLWPQPRDGTLGYHRKDALERTFQKMVCARKVGLQTAQTALASDWIAAYRRYIGPIPGTTTPSGTTTPGATNGTSTTTPAASTTPSSSSTPAGSSSGTQPTSGTQTPSGSTIKPLASAGTLGATRKGVPFVADASLDNDGKLALQASVKDDQLQRKGAFVGNVISGPHIGRVYVAGSPDRSIEGVVLVPLRVEGLDGVGNYEGSLNIARDAKPAEAVKIKLKVTDAWWWAVGAILLGAVLIFLPKAYLRRWRPERELHYRHRALDQEYEDSQASVNALFPEYAPQGPPGQAGAAGQAADAEPVARGPFTRPSPADVERYEAAIDLAIRNYAKSTYYFNTASDSYKKIEASLEQVEKDAEFFGAANGFGLALRGLDAALVGLAAYLSEFPVDREPGIAVAAAMVLKGSQLQVGEATARAATARGFTTLILTWQEMAARLRRYEAWLASLYAFAEELPGEPSRMDSADRRLLALVRARINEVGNELLDANDAAAFEALGTSKDLDSIYRRLAYLGGRYDIWVPPEVPAGGPLGTASRRQALLAPATQAPSAGRVSQWIAQAPALHVEPAQAVAIGKTLRALLDVVVLILALAVGVVTALASFYFGKTFGTVVDYLTVIVIGSGAQVVVKGFTDVLVQLRTPDAEPPAVKAPAAAEAKT